MDESSIRFVIDGRIRTVSGIDPNTTVLNYLREDLRKTGTKEGCAEGDCGACTVVLGELVNDRVRFRAVNACIQFLPTLNGKALFTVESLRDADGDLHPVQEAMVGCHGSQCGFCTPGFVMSLFALYRSEGPPSRSRIQDILAGNLCRCTGYRPIIDAAEKMYELGSSEDARWLNRPYADSPELGEEEQALVELLREIQPEAGMRVAGPGAEGDEHEFHSPTSVDEFARLLEANPGMRILAGGTDVGLWVTKDHQDIESIAYLGNVDELRTIGHDGAFHDIGAGVALTDLETLLGDEYPDLGELLRRFASPPIRNAATLGGNIANGSPIGDSMPALIALGCVLVLRKGEKRRELPLDEFYLGYRKTALEPGEFVERIRVPVADDREFRAYKISKRFDQDISAVLGAFCARLADGAVEDIRICFGGMAATPLRAAQCEQALRGQKWSELTVLSAASELANDYAPIDDMRASAGYRGRVARNLLHKFYLDTSGFAGRTRVLASGA